MSKQLLSRADLQSTIIALKAMPAASVIEGATGALDAASEFSVADLEKGLSDGLLTESIGAMLRNARVDSGLTGTELAARLRLSKMRISQLERVGLEIEVSTLARVAEALGCELRLELVRRTGKRMRFQTKTL